MLSVSAVIPCYNAERFVGEAVESVLRQTRPADEVLVVDDASTDRSAEIVAQFRSVRLLRSRANAGEGAARNVGIRAAHGDVVAWLDADDFWEPHHLATVTPLLERYRQAAAAFGGTRRFGARTGEVLGYIPPGPPSNVFWAAFDDWVHTMIASVIRRAALLEIGGFDEKERFSVDYDLWLRLSRRYAFVCTQEITSNWRWHATQMSTRPDLQRAAVYRSRRRMWQTVAAEGDHALAASIARRMRELLEAELHRAWYRRDAADLQALVGLAPLVPGMTRRTRLKWTIRAGFAAMRATGAA